MAHFNSLLVTGDSRFLNPINGNARNGVYYVKGTQTASTGAWTGNIPIPALYDGLTIMYYLPYAGSGNATLNLTLSNGTTTGAKNCYYSTSRLTTHYGKGSNIVMTYHPAGTISVDGTATTDDRWIANANYDTNTTTENRITYFAGKTGAKGIWQTSLFMQDNNGTYQNICTASDGTVTSSNRTSGTTKIANTNGFRVGSPIWYTNTTYAANTNISVSGVVYSSFSIFDSRFAFNTQLVANSLTPYTPLYLVGTINSTDGLFYLDSTWWTQNPNNTAKIYVLVGACYDSTTSNCRISLYEQNKWYKYDGSKLVEVPFIDTYRSIYSENTEVLSETNTLPIGFTSIRGINISHGGVTQDGELIRKTITFSTDATTIPMSSSDNTTVYTAISGKADNVNLPAVQGGTDNTLVTTGDKYNWDNNDASGKVSKSGDTMTGALTMAGQDIVLGTADSSSDDSGDIVWKYGDGTEKMRIWSDNSPTTTSGPKYRVYKSDGTSLYSGYLALGDANGWANGSNLLNTRAEIGTSSQNHAQALKSYFDSYKSSTPRDVGINFYSKAYGNGAISFGYFLNGYDSTPYGGFYVCHYNNPRYVGIQNGTYTQYELYHSGSTIPIANGGTGATTAANARTNLSTPAMTTETYPALLPTSGSNDWIKIGTSNTSYGILPSQGGGAGSGHNFIGTSSWYWKYAYIDQIYGYLNGNISGSSTSCSGNASTATNASYSSYASLFSAGSTTSTTAKNFTIPTQAAEIIVTAQFASKLFCSSVPKGVLTTSNQELWVGGGRGNSLGAMNSDSARAICNVKISGTTFTLQGIASNNEGTVTTSSTTWRVYYR